MEGKKKHARQVKLPSTKEEISTAEAADLFRGLADELGRGTISLQGEPLEITGQLSLKTSRQMKKGRIRLEISLRARLAGESGGRGTAEEGQGKKERYPASGGKQLKKEISRLWKEVGRDIKDGATPSRNSGLKLLQKCEEYSLNANSRWFSAWQDCCQQLKECLQAAEAGNHEQAREMAAEVNRLTKECHRLYK